jgi:hypothetical protein
MPSERMFTSTSTRNPLVLFNPCMRFPDSSSSAILETDQQAGRPLLQATPRFLINSQVYLAWGSWDLDPVAENSQYHLYKGLSWPVPDYAWGKFPVS